MKTLDEHNAQRRAGYMQADTYPRFNGIACPDCGNELQDMNSMTLTSSPPQKAVGCPKCGYRGYRVC